MYWEWAKLSKKKVRPLDYHGEAFCNKFRKELMLSGRDILKNTNNLLGPLSSPENIWTV